MFFFFSSRRRHTRLQGDWSSDVCSSDLDADCRRGGAVRRNTGAARGAGGAGRAAAARGPGPPSAAPSLDRESTRLNSSHLVISYALFSFEKKKKKTISDIN